MIGDSPKKKYLKNPPNGEWWVCNLVWPTAHLKLAAK